MVQILRLSYNQLHALDQDLFEHLPALEVLSLDNNPIKAIDHITAIALSDIPNLKVRKHLSFYAILSNIFYTQKKNSF